MKSSLLLLFCSLAAALDNGQKGYFCEDIKKSFFAETAAAKGEFKAQRNFAIPEKFLMPKPAGVKRVFVVGESVAVILGQGRAAQAAGVGVLAAKARSRVEIINCGMSGYESYRLHDVLKEVLSYSPDLLVIMSGNNEGFPSRSCPGLCFELRGMEFRLLERYYSLKHSPQQARKMASRKMHGAMLEKMARAAKKAGVPVIFCTLPANAKDMPTRSPMRFENRQFASGYRFFYERSFSTAAEEFRRGLLAAPEDHYLNFYAAKTLEKLGRSGEAGPYFMKALDYDPDMDRADAARNALIRRVAGSEGACVADLDKLFQELSPGGLPGFHEFVDGVHWHPSYNKTVWGEIFRSAAACRITGFDKFKAADNSNWKETPREDAVKRLNYALSWLNGSGLNGGALAELSYIRQELPGLLKEAVVSREKLEKLLLHNSLSLGQSVQLEIFFPEFLMHVAETERRLGNYGPAMALCERALSLKPGDKFFRLVRAQILAGLGRREEAEKEFRESIQYREASALGLAYGLSVP